MEKKKCEDMLSILELNSSIGRLYNKLCELELNGQMNSDEYNEYVEMIRFARRRCDHYYLKYPLCDAEMNDFIELLMDLNRINPNQTMDFLSETPNIKIKRFIEHNTELASIYHEDAAETQVIFEDITDQFFDGELELMSDELEDYDDDDLEAEEDAVNNLLQKYSQTISIDLDNYNQLKFRIESHIFISYLIDAINNEKNMDVKKKLIETKYRIISMVRNLEDTFLYNNSFEDINFDYLNLSLNDMFNKYNEFYGDYVDSYEQLIAQQQNLLLDRNKEKYDTIDEYVQDILLGISLQTYISCIPNDMARDAIIEDQETAIDLSTSKIDKKVLKKSIKLNKKYVLPEQQ